MSIVLISTSLARAADITGCGQVVEPGDIGVLRADLSCPTAGASPAVLVNDKGTLMLNGHSLGGGGIGVHCAGQSCRIYGPGEIVGSSSDGIQQLLKHGRVWVRDVVIRDHSGNGVSMYSDGRLALDRVTATGNLNGVRADAVRVRGQDLITSDNQGSGMVVARYRFKRLTLQNNGFGADSAPGFASQDRGSFVDSNVTANGQPGGVDIATSTPPGFVRSTCDRSGIWPRGGVIPGDADPSWEICSLD